MRCSGGDIPRARARRAFSLLEVIVSLAIAAMGVGGVLTALVQAQRSQQRLETADAELAIARDLIEQAFLGVLAEDDVQESEGALTVYESVTGGVSWRVEVLTTVSVGFNARAATASGAGLGQSIESLGAPTPQMPVEIVTVRAGTVELVTSRW